MSKISNRVLVLGVYLANEKNAAEHVVSTLAQSARWDLDQRWCAVGQSSPSPTVANVTRHQVNTLQPKFILLNALLRNVNLDDYAFVIVADDDILLPPEFLDTYLSAVAGYQFALSQPARTHDSYIDHPFVEQLDGLVARETRFVEIGPLFCMRHDAAVLLLPFDEESPMGWGYDLVWPCTLRAAQLTLGIIDKTPVAHSIRKPITHYDHGTANAQMSRFLEQRSHLSRDEAFLVVNAYA